MPIIKFFWKHIKPYKWYYLIMFLVSFVSSFYSLAYNYSIKLLIDALANSHIQEYRPLLFPIMLFMGIQFVLDLVWRISNFAEWRSVPYVRQSVLLDSYNYVQYHSYTFFQNNFAGVLTSKIKGILDGYDKFWSAIHHGVIHNLFKVFVNLAGLTRINLKIGLMITIWSAIYAPIMYYLSRYLNHLAFSETESRHNLMGQISDKITNILTVLCFSARKKELRNLNQSIEESFIPKQLRFYYFAFKTNIIASILYWIMFAILLFYTIHLKFIGILTVGDVTFIFGLVFVTSNEIWHVTVKFQDFARDMGDLKSALSILQEPHTSLDSSNALPLKTNSDPIEFKNITFAFDDKKVFDGLNLTIKPGEKLGVVGSSGAGKSSLVHLLLRYFEPQKGAIFINYQDISTVTQDSLREQISVIPQDTILFHSTIIDNIRYGKMSASYEEIETAAKKAHIHDYIMTLPEKYETEVGERGLKLSGGQRQRIAIARAILKNAPIFILDEATSALDSGTEKLIQDSLNMLIKDKKKTIIAIAHRLSTLKHMDRIIVLDKGRIVEQGTHKDLINKPGSVYKKLWEHQEI